MGRLTRIGSAAFYEVDMRDKDKDIIVNTEHRTLRIVLFVLALAVAVTAFTTGVLQIGHKDTGYQTVAAEPDSDAVGYANDVTFKYYLEGSSNEIKEQLKAVTSAYSATMKRAYKFLDASKEYPGYTNIATINKAINSGSGASGDIAVSAELYEILKTAYDYSRRSEGFNLFAGELYAYWNSILSLEDPAPFDPALEQDEAYRLSKLAAETALVTDFRIEFADDEQHIIRVNVSKHYMELLGELELPETLEDGGYIILDLNLLHDAFLVDWVADELERQQYTDGYLETSSDLMRSLSGHNRGEYCLYDFSAAEPAAAVTIPVNESLAVSLFRNVPVGEKEFGRYYVQVDGEKIARSQYIHSFEGQSSRLIANSYVIDTEGDIVEAAYRNIVLAGADSQKRLEILCAKLNASGRAMEYDYFLMK